MRESALQQKCNAIARAQGWWPFKLESSSETGLPDCMYLGSCGRVRFVEFKQPTGRLSARQKIIINKLRSLGFDVQVIRTVAEFEEWI